MITEWKRYSNQRMLRSPSTGQAEGVPAIELFFKDLAAELFQIRARLFFGSVLRKQVDCWLASQILQAQLGTGWVRLTQLASE